MPTSPETAARLLDDLTNEFASGSKPLPTGAVAFRDDEALLWMTAPDGGDAGSVARVLGLGAPVAVADCLVYFADSTAQIEGKRTDAIVSIIVLISNGVGTPTLRMHPYRVTRKLTRTRRQLDTPVTLDAGTDVFGPVVDGLMASLDIYGDDSIRLAGVQKLMQQGVELKFGDTLDQELNALMSAR